MRRQRMKIALATIAAFGLLALFPGSARADNCDEEQREVEEGKKKNYRTVTGPDGRKVFVIEKAFVVCGKVPKPTVIYGYQVAPINYEWANLKKDFVPLILATVKEAPF
jgi:hypothetical protein